MDWESVGHFLGDNVVGVSLLMLIAFVGVDRLRRKGIKEKKERGEKWNT